MRLGGKRIEVLLAHGLHESQARVYLTLLEHPTLAAGTLAGLAHVPRSHLYTVLQELHQRGLVDILVEGRARTYRARPFAEFLTREAEAARARLARIEEEIKTIAPILEPPPHEGPSGPEAGEVRVILGRRAVARELEELIQRAREQIVFACSDGGWRRSLAHLLPWGEVWRKAPQKAPHVRIYLPPAAAKEEAQEQLEEALPRCSVHWYRIPRSMMALSVDTTEILFVHPIPDSPEPRTGRDFAIYTKDQLFVENHLALLDEVADAAAPKARAGAPP